MRSKSGFTLVEILIVVVILGILAAIVIPQFTDASQEAKTNSDKSNLSALRSQLELWKVRESADGASYPATLAQLVTDGYLQQVPTCPFNDEAYNYVQASGAVTSPYDSNW